MSLCKRMAVTIQLANVRFMDGKTMCVEDACFNCSEYL
jgi:hypothetical protein